MGAPSRQKRYPKLSRPSEGPRRTKHPAAHRGNTCPARYRLRVVCLPAASARVTHDGDILKQRSLA